MAKACALDVECTKVPRHFPWVEGSYLVSVHLYSDYYKKTWSWLINHPEATKSIAECRDEIQEKLNEHDWLVNQNLKFDLHWMDELELDYIHMHLFDTQHAEYMLTAQHAKLISLHDLCDLYDIPNKLDKVKQMWDAGFETDEIPADILVPYGNRDVESTMAVAKKQMTKLFGSPMWPLYQIKMREMAMLKRAERAGMLFDCNELQASADDYEQQIKVCRTNIMHLSGNEIENISSSLQKSCMLFGGEFKAKMRVDEFKSLSPGPVCYCIESVGRVWINYTKQVKGMGFKPPVGSETANPGQYQTNAGTLAALVPRNKKQKQVLVEIAKINRLSKIRSTYLIGLQKHIQADGLVHTTFKQSWTITGRDSSEAPNDQNLPRDKTGPVKSAVKTRFRKVV